MVRPRDMGKPRRNKHTDAVEKGLMSSKYSEFWTNFSRASPNIYEVLPYDPNMPGYWSFKTNLDKDDFDYVMTPAAITRFLYQMVDIYRKANAG